MTNSNKPNIAALILAVCLVIAAALVKHFQPAKHVATGTSPKTFQSAIILSLDPVFPSRSSDGEISQLQSRVKAKISAGPLAPLSIRYPNDGSLFPPEIVAPTFTWENPNPSSTQEWLIEFSSSDSQNISVLVPSQGPQPFNIDPEINPEGKELPLHRSENSEAWTPAANLWNRLKQKSSAGPCRVSITGFSDAGVIKAVCIGTVTFQTSADPVGAPIFYRDVPFIPVLKDKAESILPLDGINMRLINWRLRDISRASSKVILKDMPTCANCHTFSKDGRTLGMDIDGTQGDKGAYGIQKVSRQMTFKREDLVSWNYDFKGKRDGKTLGFMASISPDGDFVVTTVNEKLFTVGYMDPTFSQVFYPTRGILAYYSRAKRVALPLPGADNPEYVHCSPTWTPDGKYIVFSRAKAKDPFTKFQKMPAHANDSEETPMQYDLFKIPFNGGKGGTAISVAGACGNGKSNNFAKVTPDGKFIVWVQCRNGLLMRPDSKLWIVPTEGGTPRLMRCNTTRMNSWHSFSPNGRWMVFSSKEFSPYTQLFLTHLDDTGKDSPFILLPNSTADNRAANLPEFANIAYDDMDNIDVPAVSHYRYQVLADQLFKSGAVDSGIKLLRQALDEEKKDRAVRAEIMATLGDWLPDSNEVIRMLKDAIKNDSTYSQSYFELGLVLDKRGRQGEAVSAYKKCLAKDPANIPTMLQLAKIFMASDDTSLRDIHQAFYYADRANRLTYSQKAYVLENLARVYSEMGRFEDAAATAQLATARALELNEPELVERTDGEAKAFAQGRKFTTLIRRNKS